LQGATAAGGLASQLGFAARAAVVAALFVAVVGAIVVRVILEALSPNDRR
jgi:uncharacterized membrane protein YeaQ/YmgE (transglycosylase-associated protein family)